MSQSTEANDGEGLFPSIKPVTFKLGFYAFLMLWLAYLLVQTLQFEDFEDVVFPFLVGVPLLILLGTQFVIIKYPGLVDKLTPDDETSEDDDDGLSDKVAMATAEELGVTKREKEINEIRMIAWVTALPFVMYFLGMGWTLLIYVFAFTYSFVGDWKKAVGMTVGVTAFIYILFVEMLSMIIWTGAIRGIPDPLQMLSLLL